MAPYMFNFTYRQYGVPALVVRICRFFCLFRWAAEDFIAQSRQKLVFVTVEICRNIYFISYIL